MPKFYVGNSSNRAKKSKKVYIGNSSNKAKRCKKIYIGDSNNKARLAFCDLPTSLYIYSSSLVSVNLTYDGQTQSLGSNNTISVPSSNFSLKNPQDTIRLGMTRSLTGDTFNREYQITGGQSNNIYAMPEKTFFWYTQSTTIPTSFTYGGTGGGYTMNNQMHLYADPQLAVSNYTGNGWAKFYTSQSGYLNVLVSTGDLGSVIKQFAIYNENTSFPVYYNLNSYETRLFSQYVSSGYVYIYFYVDNATSFSRKEIFINEIYM